MVRNIFSALLLASSFAPAAFAQTHTDCNPLQKKCPNNPGLTAKSLAIDFTKQKAIPDGWATENQGELKFEGDGAKMVVAKPNDSLNLVSKFYFLFGSFEFKVKVAPGKGIISTVVLISDDLDEVDWEMLSIEPNDAQSNYFGKGDDKVFDRGGKHPVPNNQQQWHTYRFDWTPDYVSWFVDGQNVRTLKYADAQGGARFPQSPMRIKIGAWAAGDPSTNRPGTVEWSGGPTDWKAGPFVMAVESIKITNFSPAKEYEYSDQSGSYKSIKLIDGTLMSNSAGAQDAPPAPAPSASKPVESPPPPISSIKPTATQSIPPTSTPPVASVELSTSVLGTTLSPSTSSTGSASTTSRAAPAAASTNAASGNYVASGFALCAVVMSLVFTA